MTRTNVWLGAFVTVALCGCEKDGNKIVGSGISRTERRSVGVFDEFELHGAGRVELAIGELKPLEVTADDNILPVLLTEVVGKRLVVRPARPISTKQPIVLRGTVPEITLVSVDGTAEITLSGIQNDSLRLDLKGVARVNARGETKNLGMSVEGAGYVQAEDLQARHVEAALTGAGSVDTHAIETLKVTITGSGIVTYSGDPKIEKQIVGLGTLRKK